MTTVTESTSTATRRGMEIDDLLRLHWIADPQISPDGTRIAFTRVSVDHDADDYRTQVWVIPTTGGEPRPLTQGGRDRQPRSNDQRAHYLHGTSPPCRIGCHDRPAHEHEQDDEKRQALLRGRT